MIFNIKQDDNVRYGMIAVCAQFSDEQHRKEDREHGYRDAQLVPQLFDLAIAEQKELL